MKEKMLNVVKKIWEFVKQNYISVIALLMFVGLVIWLTILLVTNSQAVKASAKEPVEEPKKEAVLIIDEPEEPSEPIEAIVEPEPEIDIVEESEPSESVVEPVEPIVEEVVEAVEPSEPVDIVVDTPVEEEPVTEDYSASESFVENPYYTEAEAIALAKMVWGEARGVPALENASRKCQQAATIWCVLNRVDAGYADTIAKVVSAPGAFHGYVPSYPVKEELLDLVYDVLGRWVAEKNGATDVGRVLPSDYLWFASNGKGNNTFRNQYSGSKVRWDWSLGDPYDVPDIVGCG